MATDVMQKAKEANPIKEGSAVMATGGINFAVDNSRSRNVTLDHMETKLTNKYDERTYYEGA